MQCFISTNRDIYFNLALEEYLLMQETSDFFVLWQSEPAVVVGKHQNAAAEINHRFVRENDILVARRLSGGGTVYHDAGNLNFTYIASGEAGKLVDFKRFIEPVIDFLNSIGIDARQGPKNEILARDKKISGNAEHVHKNRVLHHGTLLFHSNLNVLRESLKVVPGRYKDKAVQSNRSSVINISECLDKDMDLTSFEGRFLDFMVSRTGGNVFEPGEEIKNSVTSLANSKYRSWEWIYGWSPDYEINSEFHFENLDCLIHIKVHRGIMKDCVLKSNTIPGEDLERLKSLLLESRHEWEQVRTVLKDWNNRLISGEKETEEMVWSFF